MNKLFWIDLEMTGLDVTKEVIIEAAAIITDLEFNELDRYHAIIKQPQSYIDSMDDWNRRHHGDSGLTAQIPHGLDPAKVEQDLMALSKKHFAGDRPILAGNSISQDRLFIDKYWPNWAAMLHYRSLDVTSWKLIFNNIYKKTYPKNIAHRALGDIEESIGELKYYMGFINLQAE